MEIVLQAKKDEKFDNDPISQNDFLYHQLFSNKIMYLIFYLSMVMGMVDNLVVLAVMVMVIDYHYIVRMFFCRHQLVLALYGIVWPVWSCKGESHLCKAHWVNVPHLII